MSYTNKTQPTVITPEAYLDKNFPENILLKEEALQLVDIYAQATNTHCIMWNKIFGFGTYYYLDSTGGEHSYLMTGFAISKKGFTLYNIMGWETYKKDIEKLGTYSISGKSCLVIKKISDIDIHILVDVLKKSVADMKQTYKTEL